MSINWKNMNQIEALGEEFDTLFEVGDLDNEYAEYIMDNHHGERVICNGDTLIEAMESFFLLDEFKEDWVEKRLTLVH